MADEEQADQRQLLDEVQHRKSDDAPASAQGQGGGGQITRTGLKVLCLLAVQNCSKNLIMRYAVKDKPDFLYSAAVIGSELTKLTLSTQ